MKQCASTFCWPSNRRRRPWIHCSFQLSHVNDFNGWQEMPYAGYQVYIFYIVVHIHLLILLFMTCTDNHCHQPLQPQAPAAALFRCTVHELFFQQGQPPMHGPNQYIRCQQPLGQPALATEQKGPAPADLHSPHSLQEPHDVCG